MARRSSPPADWACQARPTSRRPDRGIPRRPGTTSETRLVRTLHWPATRRACSSLNTPSHEMAASTPSSLKRCGSEASTSFSLTAWVEPNSRQLTNFTSGYCSRSLSSSALEDFVAGEEIVPELGDGLAVQRVEPLGERTLSSACARRTARRLRRARCRIASPSQIPFQLRTMTADRPRPPPPPRLLPSPRRHCHHNRPEPRPPRRRARRRSARSGVGRDMSACRVAQRRRNECGVRRHADERKQADAFDVGDSCRPSRCAARTPETPSLPRMSLTSLSQTNVDVLARSELLDIVALCLQRTAAHHDHAPAGLGEHERLLHRAVAAADDDDILAAIKAAIARRTDATGRDRRNLPHRERRVCAATHRRQ